MPQCPAQGVYRLRNPRATELLGLVEDNFDELELVWDERYERQFSFWRAIIRHVVERYMDCGDLRCGFARLLVHHAAKTHFCLIVASGDASARLAAKNPSALKTLEFLSRDGGLSYHDGNPLLFDCLSEIHFQRSTRIGPRKPAPATTTCHSCPGSL